MPIIAINDVIDDFTVMEIDNILKDADLSEDYDIIISSGGGSVIAGLQVVSKLDMIKGKKTAHIQGLAASMATVIACACDEVSMSENGFFMIHNVWTMAIGESDDLRKEADLMDKMRDQAISIYQRKANLSTERLQELMSDETWMTPAEALELGFIDSISKGEMAMAASIYRNGLNQFKNLPKELETKLKGVSAMADFEETEELLEEVEVEETSEEVEELDGIENDEQLEDVEEVVEESETEELDSSDGFINRIKAFLKPDNSVDYKGKYNAVLEENDSLAELANGLQDKVNELEGQLEDAERCSDELINESAMVINAVLSGKITHFQLEQWQEGKIDDEQLANAIKNQDLKLMETVEREEVLKPVAETEVPLQKLNNADFSKWLNQFKGKTRSLKYKEYNKKHK